MPYMGGSALTPGNPSEISSLRIEHTVALTVLLVLYDIQMYMGSGNEELGEITIWLDNTEVISRARRTDKGNVLQDTLVLDVDMWPEMDSLQALIKISIKWEKVDSYIATRTYKLGVKPKGGKYVIQLNKYVDELVG